MKEGHSNSNFEPKFTCKLWYILLSLRLIFILNSKDSFFFIKLLFALVIKSTN